MDALIFEDVQKVQESIDRLMVLIMKEQPEKETLLQNCMYFDYELHKYMEKYELPIEEVLRRSRKTPQQFLAMENVQEIQLWLQDLKKDLTSYVRRTTVTDREKLVSRIDDYIARHYAEEEMGIQMMAEKMGFSCGYFGALVKKLTGETFSRRLTRYRMEKAKQLLTGSDLRIQEVGASVGIPDQFYFSRVFKRVVGESPVEYRSAAAGMVNRP